MPPAIMSSPVSPKIGRRSGAVGLEQRVAAPALQARCELPAEVRDVFEARVETEAAVGRVLMGGVAGDEDAAACGSCSAIMTRRSQKPMWSNSASNVEAGAS